MGVAQRYIDALPAKATLPDGEEVEFDRMIPLWYFLMAQMGVPTFRDACVEIRTGSVKMSVSKQRPYVTVESDSEMLQRHKKEIVGNFTNPDTLLFCRLTPQGLESLDAISYRRADEAPAKDGLLTEAQFSSLPELYQQVLERDELPRLIISDAASVWFDD